MYKNITDYYHRNIGIYELYPFVSIMAEALGETVYDDHKKLLEEHAEKEERDDNKTVYIIPPDIIGTHVKYLDKKAAFNLSKRILPQSLIVSLVSQFDLFVSKTIKYVYEQKSELLNSMQRNITYSEINTLGDINRIKAYMIEKEIEAVLRDSHVEQIRWFEKKLNLNLSADKALLAEFVEITQRRNLFVHSDGIVSQQYISSCKEVGYDCSNIKAGNKLQVDKKYFCHAADKLMEIGCKLGQIIWRNINPDEKTRANESLNEITYNLINSGRNKVAANILEFFINNRNRIICDATHEYRTIINAAQAYKWSGNNEKCMQILDGENWESKSDNFLLTSLVLREKYKDAANLMKTIGSERHGINKGSYHEWPVFKEFRKTEEFLNAYQEVYGEIFKVRKNSLEFQQNE